ncbi:MAG TPA: sulfatase [Planctomycetota bacterium]|nr:sulfatase [Planctomycetota bacterium]
MRWFALALGLVGLAPQSEPDPRPNILFCIADDWSWPHAGAYGDRTARTPNFDRVAREGVLFTRAFCASPSCTPSRAAILTGQAIHRLEESGNLWSTLQARFEVYPDLLEKAGYAVGLQGKGWGPGDFRPGGRSRNPAGPSVKNFADFLRSLPAGKPFCFWFGSGDPHRPYERGSGRAAGYKLEEVSVPPYLPDTPEVREDLLDYYFEVERFDRQVGELLRALEASGRASNTIVVITSDNGMPFPRCKTNLYDSGSRMPLAIRWPGRVQGGRTAEPFVSLADLAPTFLEAAGLPVPASMTGRSLLPLLEGRPDPADRTRVFLGRERHANVRKGDLSYPARAVRTAEWLLIRNFKPDRWPGGDPEKHVAVGPFGDCDNSPTKEQILARRDQDLGRFFLLAFGKRPARELYDLARDPHQIENVAERHPDVVARLEAELLRWMSETKDPRAADPDDDRWDRFPYYGK